IVIDKLTEVRKNVDFHDWLWRRGRDGLAILAVGGRRCCSATDGEGVFPLLSQAFRVDVVIPYHSSIDERVRHAAASKRKAGEPFVPAVRLSDKDAVVTLCEWSATAWRRG